MDVGCMSDDSREDASPTCAMDGCKHACNFDAACSPHMTLVASSVTQEVHAVGQPLSGSPCVADMVGADILEDADGNLSSDVCADPRGDGYTDGQRHATVGTNADSGGAMCRDAEAAADQIIDTLRQLFTALGAMPAVANPACSTGDSSPQWPIPGCINNPKTGCVGGRCGDHCHNLGRPAHAGQSHAWRQS
eukprot:NODE_21955_length_729_cov_1.895349.p1 GENE.NODE_21955_length_729_cov_1.895349~~NODE_21955_length_729_cov_1.895349.p1  ORF type:complete len:192 (+),score=15.11 NODE_21955_length_729_cov_1.895349:34-609(+)